MPGCVPAGIQVSVRDGASKVAPAGRLSSQYVIGRPWGSTAEKVTCKVWPAVTVRLGTVTRTGG